MKKKKKVGKEDCRGEKVKKRRGEGKKRKEITTW